MGLVSSARVGMFRCHANPAISRRIGRVGAEVSKKKAKKRPKKAKDTLVLKRSQVSFWLLETSNSREKTLGWVIRVHKYPNDFQGSKALKGPIEFQGPAEFQGPEEL